MPLTLTTTPSGRRLLHGPLFQRSRLGGKLGTRTRRMVVLCQPSTIEDVQAAYAAFLNRGSGSEEVEVGATKEDVDVVGNLGCAAILGTAVMIVNTSPRTFIHFAHVKNLVDEADVGTACCFTLQTGHKDYRFAAESSSDYQIWIAAIRTAVALRKTHNKQQVYLCNPSPANHRNLSSSNISLIPTDADATSLDTRGRQTSSTSTLSPKPSLILPPIADATTDDNVEQSDRSMSVTTLCETGSKVGEGSINEVVEQVGTKPTGRSRLFPITPLPPPMRSGIRNIKSYNDIIATPFTPVMGGIPPSTRPVSPPLSTITSLSSSASMNTNSSLIVGGLKPKSTITSRSPSPLPTVNISDLSPTKNVAPYPSPSPSPPETHLHNPFHLPRKVSAFFRTIQPPSTTALGLNRFHGHQQRPVRRPSSPDLPGPTFVNGEGRVEGGGGGGVVRGRGRSASNPTRVDPTILSF
ncbi:hypothetical protein HDV00_010977, partial [Rhizophlyctis rosea]